MRPAGKDKKFRRCGLVVLLWSLWVSEVDAADLGTPPGEAAVFASDSAPRWYVKLGVVGVFDQSSSNLYSQTLATVVAPGVGPVPLGGIGPQTLLVGRGATYSDVYTASLEAGYFLTPNWSLEVATGFPVWLKVRITGFSPAAPAAGTVLTEVLPAAVPITAVYHFRQLGALQPYLGVGLEPSFLLFLKDGFSTGGSYDPTVGLVFQGGFDYMLAEHWGVFFDMKKIFAQSKGTATGINLGPPIGVVPVGSTIRTSGQPWLATAGLTYRF